MDVRPLNYIRLRIAKMPIATGTTLRIHVLTSGNIVEKNMNSRWLSRAVLVTAVFCLSLLGFAQESYLGMFLQGTKIGYVYSNMSIDKSTGQTLNKSVSDTIMNAAMLGDALALRIHSETLSNEAGQPQVMRYTMVSGGRTQKVEANFIGKQIRLVIDNNGTRSTRTLEVPKDGKVVDDAVNGLLTDQVKPGTKVEFYVLDPMTVSLVKNTVTLVGQTDVTVKGKTVKGTLVTVTEPRANMNVYLDSKNEIIKIDGPMGIEMIPISKEEALADSKNSGKVDLAGATRIQPNKPLSDIRSIKSLKLRIKGPDMSRVPTIDHQSIKKSGAAWELDIHPVDINGKTLIADSAKAKPQWTKPGLHIPSSQASFKALASQIIGGSKTVAEASEKIRQYVGGCMVPNAGIGVLRDANEILKSKEGVCRDYAILTATLLRAANIPTRLCSGLVYQDGAYYYHAWTEVWDGARWAGVDSTRPDGKVRAGHITLATGSVEDAFLFTFLDKATIEVVGIVRR